MAGPRRHRALGSQPEPGLAAQPKLDGGSGGAWGGGSRGEGPSTLRARSLSLPLISDHLKSGPRVWPRARSRGYPERRLTLRRPPGTPRAASGGEFSGPSGAPTPGHPAPARGRGPTRGPSEPGKREARQQQAGGGDAGGPRAGGVRGRPRGRGADAREGPQPCRPAARAEPRTQTDAFGSTYCGLIDPAARVSARGAGCGRPSTRPAPHGLR